MPWTIKQNDSRCSGWAVVKDSNNELEGCHETQEKAKRQLAALHASEAMIAETIAMYERYETELAEPGKFKVADSDTNRLMRQQEDELNEVVALAMTREIDEIEFIQRYSAIVLSYLLAAALLGADVVTEAQLPPQTITELNEQRLQARAASVAFARDIYSGRYDENEDSAKKRVVLWLVSTAGAYALGRLAFPEEKLQWRLGLTFKHCVDCARLDGQVHTASDWAASGWRPQGKMLECGGWRCDCSLIRVSRDTPEDGFF